MKGDWRMLPMPAVFEADFAAWLQSLSRKARAVEATMHWTDLGPFAVSAYSLHADLAGRYEYLRHRGQAPVIRPDDTTPEGFYLLAVETRHRQIGLHHPFAPTPYERLSPFSHFIYQRMADRVAAAAGFGSPSTHKALLDDGLGDGLDDGLDDGLALASDEDGLDAGLDDGLEL